MPKPIILLKALLDGLRIENEDCEFEFTVPTLADDNKKRFCMVAYKTNETTHLSETVYIQTGLKMNDFLESCESFKILK